jgi:NADPH:quinone reductase-like Zn-dependent oxidoreductase
MSSDVRAVVIDAFGDSPHLATFPRPEPGPDQVLIEVRAASVNAFDWKAAEGRGGRAASVHRAVDEAMFAERGLSGTNVASFPDRGLLEELGALAAHGGLRVAITGRYTLDEAVKALADAKERHSRGKLVIEVTD